MFDWFKKLFKRYVDLSPIWGIRLSSHTDEGELYKNVITIFLGTYIKSFILPFNIIKPIIDYHVYMKDINDNDMADIMATAYSTNIYGITYLPDDDCIEFNWNYADDMYKNINNHKGILKHIYLFWNYRTKVKTMLLNLDSTVFTDITDSTETNKEYMTLIQPRYYISILDRENIPRLIECRATLDVYTYGGSLITKLFMSIFKKPVTVRTIHTGVESLSYRATLTMDDNESILDTFKRQCRINRYKFISVVEKG